MTVEERRWKEVLYMKLYEAKIVLSKWDSPYQLGFPRPQPVMVKDTWDQPVAPVSSESLIFLCVRKPRMCCIHPSFGNIIAATQPGQAICVVSDVCSFHL